MKERREGEAEIIWMPERFDSTGLAPAVGQVLFLPLTMMMYGLNLLARTARAMPMPGPPEEPRRVASPHQARAIESDTGRDPPPVAAPSGWSSLPLDWKRPPLAMVRSESSPDAARYAPGPPVQTQQPRNVGSHEPQGREEQRRMVDNKSLQDDMLKTVRYWVSFEKRGYETVLYQGIDQVYDNLTDAQFTAWKMAEFMKKLDNGRIDLPFAGTADQKRPFFTDHATVKGALGDVDPDDKRYLALDWEVVGRVQRRRGWFDERKTEALEEIADNMKAQRTLNIVISKP